MHPPVTLFSPRAAPRVVLDLVLRAHPEALVTPGPDSWRRIEVGFESVGLGTLILRHDPDYTSGSNWARQQAGMVAYFARFPMDPERRRLVTATLLSFRFAVSVVAVPPLGSDEDDPRATLLTSVARELGACRFVPGELLDPTGRLLIDADGEYDRNATFPQIPGPPLARMATEAELDDAEQHGDDEPDPPGPGRVARRAMVLAAVAARSLLEDEARGGDPEADDKARRLTGWFEGLGLDEEAEADEIRRLRTAPGKLDDRSMIDGSWRFEGLGVLAWALGVFELPRYDTLVDPGDLLASVAFLDAARAHELLETAELRSPEVLDERRRQILAFHWRMRDYSLRPRAMDFLDFGENCWFGPLEMSWAETVDGDLALAGVPISAAPEEVVGRCSSLAMERHVAINWLCGWSEVYSETDHAT